MALTFVILVAGFVLLIGGAELLVRGASFIALALGISPLVVGLTVVAFGTSAPEMLVSAMSALGGNPGVAIGNVVGSNIFNILVVLGVSAIILPLSVANQIIKIELPLMIGVSILMWLMAIDHVIGRGDGMILFSGVIVYTVWSIRKSRMENARNNGDGGLEEKEKGFLQLLLNGLFFICGLGFLVIGSKMLVKGAVDIAHLFGVSELVIGLTIVAVGTSLPEVAASAMAAIKNERDMAVGNAVGSNLFNILSVLGISGTLAETGIPVPLQAFRFDIPVMILVSALCIPVFLTGHEISRKEGAFFIGCYSIYTFYLICKGCFGL